MVGNTPLVTLARYAAERGIGAQLLGKLEMMNPSGSVKDRAALGMIEAAEAEGLLEAGATIVEPTSGNTGIALSCMAAAKGYRCVIVMPDSMSEERRALMRAHGAELVLTPGAQGMAGAIARAKAIVGEIEGAFMPNQFENVHNALMHERTTGPELWRDAEGRIDCLVAGVGSGGTITGVARYLKGMNPRLNVVAVEPAESPVLSGGSASAHGIQGIGAGFVPSICDVKLIDEVVCVRTEEALDTCKGLAASEGLLCGISSGAALHAAGIVARRGAWGRIAVILPDGGGRYLSLPGYL